VKPPRVEVLGPHAEQSGRRDLPYDARARTRASRQRRAEPKPCADTAAATDGGLDRADRLVRFHDLRHTFASHLIIDIRLDVAQVSRILGHARTSMTLDTYTHLFEQAAHTADVRAQLARSEFANLLTRKPEPQLLAGKHLRSTRAQQRPRAVQPPARRRRACARTGMFAPAAKVAGRSNRERER
jgi:Phage integrase family